MLCCLKPFLDHFLPPDGFVSIQIQTVVWHVNNLDCWPLFISPLGFLLYPRHAIHVLEYGSEKSSIATHISTCFLVQFVFCCFLCLLICLFHVLPFLSVQGVLHLIGGKLNTTYIYIFMQTLWHSLYHQRRLKVPSGIKRVHWQTYIIGRFSFATFDYRMAIFFHQWIVIYLKISYGWPVWNWLKQPNKSWYFAL